jgi:hypothetical protein
MVTLMVGFLNKRAILLNKRAIQLKKAAVWGECDANNQAQTEKCGFRCMSLFDWFKLLT